MAKRARTLRALLLSLCLLAPVAAQAPANPPTKAYTIKLPANWVSPSPDRWTAPDGRIALVIVEVPSVRADLDGWMAEARKRYPGTLSGESQRIQLDGERGWLIVGQHQGRVQRTYFALHRGTGVILSCSCTPAQSFAAAGAMHEILQGFRWRR